MNVTEIKLDNLKPAAWNPNQMDEAMTTRLQESISRYGLVEPLVVRKMQDKAYEVLSGNQRLKVLQEMNFDPIPCIVVELDDVHAMLLAQALNGLRGEDDLVLKGLLLKQVLSSVSENEVLSLLPETIDSLKTLSTISESDMAEHLKAWDEAQIARLRHLQVQLTYKQMEIVEEALSLIVPKAKDDSFDNPNTRGNAIFLLCKFYLDRRTPE
jgi:ParB family transcriptional regulator, chromosome partitioning protein